MEFLKENMHLYKKSKRKGEAKMPFLLTEDTQEYFVLNVYAFFLNECKIEQYSKLESGVARKKIEKFITKYGLKKEKSSQDDLL